MKKLLIRLTLSLCIGGVMLYLASREISFKGVLSVIAHADWTVLGPFLLCMAAQHICRAWRWGQLLAPIHPVPFRRILPISSVGFFAILALPLRMGEIVRPYLIADPPRIRISHGLGTMAVERVFDGLVLALSGFISVAIARGSGTAVPRWISAAGMAALMLFVAALVVLVLTLWQRERAVTLCHQLFALVSNRLAARASSIAKGVVEGFQVLPSARPLLLFLGATLAYWLLNALAFWAIASGFDVRLDLGSSVALTSLIGIGIMIPAGPGFVGNFELFAEGALTMYVPRDVLRRRGAAFILASHAANACWYIATGLVAMFSAHVTFKRVVGATANPPKQPAREPLHLGGTDQKE